jgi:hypothetical protein
MEANTKRRVERALSHKVNIRSITFIEWVQTIRYRAISPQLRTSSSRVEFGGILVGWG